MGRASLLEEKRKMLFEDVYSVWTERRLTQQAAAQTAGGVPADVPALVGAPRGGRDRGPARPAAVGGVAPRGAGGRGDADGGPVPDAARGLERAALPLVAPARRRDAQLRLGEGPSAEGGRRGRA